MGKITYISNTYGTACYGYSQMLQWFLYDARGAVFYYI